MNGLPCECHGFALHPGDRTLLRMTFLLLLCSVLTSTSALGADFQFDARVRILPSLTVAGHSTEDPATAATALALRGTQDQCLELAWIDSDGEPVDVSPPAAPEVMTGLHVLDDDGFGVIDTAADTVPAGWTLQITLN